MCVSTSRQKTLQSYADLDTRNDQELPLLHVGLCFNLRVLMRPLASAVFPCIRVFMYFSTHVSVHTPSYTRRICFDVVHMCVYLDVPFTMSTYVILCL